MSDAIALRYHPATFDTAPLHEFAEVLSEYDIEHFSAHEVMPLGRETILDPGQYIEAAAILGRGALSEAERYVIALVPPPREIWARIIPTLQIADKLRKATGAPLGVNSCWRDPLYNLAVGGAAGSQHREFMAIDVSSGVWGPSRVADWLEAHELASQLGVGRYVTFTHFDLRGYRARWGTR